MKNPTAISSTPIFMDNDGFWLVYLDRTVSSFLDKNRRFKRILLKVRAARFIANGIGGNQWAKRFIIVSSGLLIYSHEYPVISGNSG